VVLSVLLLARNRPVSRDMLIDSLWGESPPATAAHTLDAYVSRLRKSLGDDRLTRSAGGYVLRVEQGELDVDRFEELVARGRKLLAAGSAGDAAGALRSALALWRGRALADLVYEASADRMAVALEEDRLAAVEERVDADLACGSTGDPVAELERLVTENPFRERLLGQLMLTLYRAGQQARALDVYRAAKRRFADELGLDPGPALQELERRILVHDPMLVPLSRSGAPRHSRRRPLAVAVAIVVLAAAIAAMLVGLRGSPAVVASGSSNRVVELTGKHMAVPLPTQPAALVAGYGALWAADPGDGSVERIDVTSHTITDRITVGGTPGLLAVGGGAVWAASVEGESVARIDPSTGTVTKRIDLGGSRLSALAYGNGALWVGDTTDRSLLEIEPATDTLLRTLTLPVEPSALAITNGAIWVADYDDNTVTEVEPRNGNVLVTAHVGTGPSALAVTAGSIWAANTLGSTVSRIDAHDGDVVETFPVGSGPDALLAAGGHLWVADEYSRSVSRIDPRRGIVTGTTVVGGSPTALCTLGGPVWVATQSSVARRGGTLILLHSRSLTIDPALQVDVLAPVSDALTRDGLVSYDHVPGPGGARLVPDLALGLPEPTGSGTTYTFRLRPGVRYSDGRLVHAADIRRAIEREFRVRGPVRDAFTGIVGANRCSVRRCDLRGGIITDEAARTVTFHLTTPDPDFLANLTNAAAGAVPPGTPWHPDSTPIPGTGPYKVVTVTSRDVVWARNPFFHEWSHAAQPDGNPDRITMRWGLSRAQEVRAVEANHADALTDNIPASLLPEVTARYADRLHSWVIPTTDFFQLNTAVAPFNVLRVRRALNLAVDRETLVRLHGGPLLASPTCQVLPPGELGYRHYCPYQRDIARARRLVAASGTRGERVTVWGWTNDPTIPESEVRYVAAILRDLGYRAGVRFVSHSFLDHPPARVFRSIQLIVAGWGDTTYGFIATWFACDGTNNHGDFCDPRIDRMNARARALQATDPHRAAAIWATIDRKLVDEAAWLPTVNERGLDFLSGRVTGYQSIPSWGMLADQLSIRG
jgi:ABC-type transport system substrate-binding protein/DNA-binding SARP family transcriptional activator